MARAAISWTNKFAVAIGGMLWAMRTQASFWCHLPIALAVIIVAASLQVELWRWAVLLLTIGLVFAVELVNTAIELLVRALHPEHDDQIGRALDVAAGAVLCAAMIAVIVGVLTLAPPLWELATDR
jgi:diacylglycerol kinase